MRIRTWLLAAALASGSAGMAAAQDAAAGAALFKTQCGICHTLIEGKNLVGPSLFGIVGRKAGEVPGFRYSEANKTSGLTWDTETLDRYLTNPKVVVPKTTMTYMGLKDDEKRANLIAFLATVH